VIVIAVKGAARVVEPLKNAAHLLRNPAVVRTGAIQMRVVTKAVMGAVATIRLMVLENVNAQTTAAKETIVAVALQTAKEITLAIKTALIVTLLDITVVQIDAVANVFIQGGASQGIVMKLCLIMEANVRATPKRNETLPSILVEKHTMTIRRTNRLPTNTHRCKRDVCTLTEFKSPNKTEAAQGSWIQPVRAFQMTLQGGHLSDDSNRLGYIASNGQLV
jgi:hypothetical protein